MLYHTSACSNTEWHSPGKRQRGGLKGVGTWWDIIFNHRKALRSSEFICSIPTHSYREGGLRPPQQSGAASDRPWISLWMGMHWAHDFWWLQMISHQVPTYISPPLWHLCKFWPRLGISRNDLGNWVKAKHSFCLRPDPSRELRGGSRCDYQSAGDTMFAKSCQMHNNTFYDIHKLTYYSFGLWNGAGIRWGLGLGIGGMGMSAINLQITLKYNKCIKLCQSISLHMNLQ